MSFKYNVYLAHAIEKDDETQSLLLAKVYESLISKGETVVYFPDRRCENPIDTFSKAVQKSQIIVVFLTKKYSDHCAMTDDWCRLEFLFAARTHQQNIIPVVLEKWFLNPENWGADIREKIENIPFVDMSDHSDSGIQASIKDLFFHIECIRTSKPRIQTKISFNHSSIEKSRHDLLKAEADVVRAKISFFDESHSKLREQLEAIEKARLAAKEHLQQLENAFNQNNPQALISIFEPQTNNSETNNSETNNSEANNSEANNSQTNNSQTNNSQTNNVRSSSSSSSLKKSNSKGGNKKQQSKSKLK